MISHEIISGAGREVTTVLYERGDPECDEFNMMLGELNPTAAALQLDPQLHSLKRYCQGDFGVWASQEEEQENQHAVNLEKAVHGYYPIEEKGIIHITTDAKRTKTRVEVDGEPSHPSRLEVTYPAGYNLEAIGGRREVVQHYEQTFGCRLETALTTRGDLRIQERTPICE